MPPRRSGKSACSFHATPDAEGERARISARHMRATRHPRALHVFRVMRTIVSHPWRVVRGGGLGALIGAVSAVISSIPFGAMQHPIGFFFTVPAGLYGGFTLGLLAEYLPGSWWQRVLVLFLGSAATVFVAGETLWIAFGFGGRWDLMKALEWGWLTLWYATPALIIGVLLCEAVLGPRPRTSLFVYARRARLAASPRVDRTAAISSGS